MKDNFTSNLIKNSIMSINLNLRLSSQTNRTPYAGSSYTGASTGASRMSSSKVTSSTYSTNVGGGGCGGGGGGKEYYVKMGGGLSSSLGGGYRVEGSSPTLLARERLISDASQKQHEETATIVTKVRSVIHY